MLTEGRLVGVLGRSDLLAVLLRPAAAIRAEVAVVMTRRVEGVEDVVDRLTWQAPERPETVPVRALL